MGLLNNSVSIENNLKIDIPDHLAGTTKDSRGESNSYRLGRDKRETLEESKLDHHKNATA